MPGGDRTGPKGMGPRTGRELGLCSGSDTPGNANRGIGRRGWGGGGGGRGRRNRFQATGTPAVNLIQTSVNRDDELASLQSEAQTLRSALEKFDERINTLLNEQGNRD